MVVMPVRPSFRSRIVRAGGWTLLAYFLTQALRLGGSLILTRLLVPEMFGVLAIAVVIQTVLTLLSDIGIRQAVIYSEHGKSRALLDTAWTFQILRGFLIWVACALVAIALTYAGRLGWLSSESVYSSAELPAITMGMALAAIVTGFQSTKIYSTNRELDLRWGATIEVISQTVGLLVAIGLAWWTRSIWSFVVSNITAAIIGTWLSHCWIPGVNNRILWDPKAAAEIFSYGRWILLSSFLYVLASNGDRFLLGGWFNASTLGVYGIAINLVGVIEVASSKLFSSVAMPALSEIYRSDRSRLSSTFLRIRLPFDIALLFFAGALFSLGPSVAQLLYDPRYEQAGYMVQWLSFTLIFARYGLAGSLYLAIGQTRNLAWLHIVRVLSMFTLTPLLFWKFGLDGALAGIVIHTAPMLPLIYWFNYRCGLKELRYELLIWPIWFIGFGFGELSLYMAAF